MKHLRLFLTAITVLLTGLTVMAQEDVTNEYLKGADLSTLEGWDYGDDGFNYTDWKTDGDVPVIEFYHTWSPNAGAAIGNTRNFHFTQTVTLPAGNYRLAVNGFYREGNGNGTNTKAYIFAGEKTQYLVGLNSAGVASYSGSNDLYKAANAFAKGDFSNEFDFDLEQEQEITIGFRGYIDTYCSWCILGPVKLLKYSLDDYLGDYRKKVSEAEALYSSKMNKDVLADLKAAVVAESTFKLVKQVTAAIQTLTEKIAAAKTSIAEYAATKKAIDTYDAKAAALDAAGKAAYEGAAAAVKSAYNDGTMTGNQAEAIRAAYQEGLKKQTAAGSDYTETAPTTWVGQTGSYGPRPERFGTTVYTGDVMTQTIEGLPAGAYEIVLEAAASTTTSRDNIAGANTGKGLTVVFANDQTTDIEVISQTATDQFGPYTVIGKVGDDGVLTYGLKNIAEGGNWFVVNLLKITKVEYIPVTAINAADLKVEVTKTAEIGATVTPTNATLPAITYTSTDESIATVDANGVVTGVAIGKTTVTLKADEITKVINVTVEAPAVLPKSITLNSTDIALDVADNRTFALTATITPAEANQEVIFQSSDEAVATIAADGTITATGIGTATITVTSKMAEKVTATAKVTVKGADAPAHFSNTIADGTEYWIRNAATGKYLGGANAWGTRASLIAHGIPFKAVAVGENTYNLDTYTSNGGNSHFLAGEWIDGAPTNINIVPNKNGTFSMFITSTVTDSETGETTTVTNCLKAKTSNTEVDLNGDNADDPFAQWYFLSATNRVDMLADGTDTDATFFIKDYNFSRNNTQYSAWEREGDITNAQNPNNSANHFNWNVENFHKTYTMTQVLGVPNGTYQLTAQGFYRQDGTDEENLPVFFANDKQGTFPKLTGKENNMNDAAHSFSAGLYKIEPITVEVTDHTLSIGAKNEVNTSVWCIWDNFELKMVSMSKNQDLNVTISEAGYATLYYPVNLNTADVTPNTVTVDGETAVLTPLPQDKSYTIPAGTPVLLEGKPGTYTMQVNTYENLGTTVGENQLKGTYADKEIKAEEGTIYYVLNTRDGKPGFYFGAEDGGTFTNKAHKAYLPVAASESAGAMAIYFDTADGISTLRTAETSDAPAYNLSGQRVNDTFRGVVIVNGKKIIKK